jgi:tRNA 2-thiouridine synthesizing protein A
MTANTPLAARDAVPRADRELDVTGVNCPLPILKTKAELAGMAPGEVLCVKYVHAEYERELEMLARQTSNRVVHTTVEGEQCKAWIRKV